MWKKIIQYDFFLKKNWYFEDKISSKYSYNIYAKTQENERCKFVVHESIFRLIEKLKEKLLKIQRINIIWWSDA